MAKRKDPPTERANRLRSISWKKPAFAGEPPRRPITGFQALSDRDSKRFWSAAGCVFLYTPLLLLAFVAIDGHWWVGNITTGSAVMMLILAVSPFLAGATMMGVFYRRGARRAEAINRRETVYETKDSAPDPELLSIPWWKLAGFLAFLCLCLVVTVEGVGRLLRGQPYHSGAYRGRYQLIHDLLGPYFPQGPMSLILFDLVLVSMIFLFAYIGWKKWRSLR